MTQRRWTLLLVPHGGAPSRYLSVSERAVQFAASALGALGLVVLLAIGLVVLQAWRATRQGTPGVEPITQIESMRALQARLDSLRDTLDAIGKRDDRIRLLAGLSTDSGSRLDETGRARTVAAEPKPSRGFGGLMLAAAESDIDWLIRRANALAASFAEVSDTLERSVERYERIPSIMPTAGWLSSHFSHRRVHPILHVARPHEGIDVSAPKGAPIIAPAAGTVTKIGREHGYGLILEIDHGDGIVTRYAHCSRITVKRGQRVQRGQQIAAVGNSGLSTGPHLHYEIRVHGKVVDPLTYVLPGGVIPD